MRGLRVYLLASLVTILLTACEGMEPKGIHLSPPDAGSTHSLSLSAPLPAAPEVLTPSPPKAPISPKPKPTLSETSVPNLTSSPLPAIPTLPALTPTPPVRPRLTRPPKAQAAVEAARAFLARYLNAPMEEIEVIYVEPVEWPDTALGCPGPGRSYAQVITPGYRVVLRVRHRQYELHTDESGKRVVLCPSPVGCECIPLRRARCTEEIVALARQDLAKRLGVPLEAVEVVKVEKAWWEGDTLGCPRPRGKYPDRAYPGPIPGYRILLAVKGVQYEYRSGALWLAFCGTPPSTEIK